MNMDQAIQEACDHVGILPPRSPSIGKWVKTDTLDGKSGKGDGRIILDEHRVTAWNWKTGDKATVWLNGEMSAVERRDYSEKIAAQDREKRKRAAEAAVTANALIEAAKPANHPYLSLKGFPDEKALVIGADDVAQIGGKYLVSGKWAIVMPARINDSVSSVQLIWEDGTKKFLAGGVIEGSSCRIAKGRYTWLCEGFATGLTLRLVLRSLKRSDTILCCFSASNVAAVARSVEGRCFVAADHDAPPKQNPEQFDGLGAGEWYARLSGKPYLMPVTEKQDINDLHIREGIFAVQRLVSNLIRSAA